MTTIRELFTIAYGNRAYHNKSYLRARPGLTPVIASGRRSNGVYGRFDVPARFKHIITVASTGSAGAACYHGYPCDVTDDALVLIPKLDLPAEEMLWYTYMIQLNQHRFNYGRKVTPERLGELEVPPPSGKGGWALPLPKLSAITAKVASDIEAMPLATTRRRRSLPEDGLVTIGELFSMTYGNSYELCNLPLDPRGVNFVSRTTRNNGVSGRVARTGETPFPAGKLTVALSGHGGVLETFVQAEDFYTGFHIAVLEPKEAMTLEEKLFYCVAIREHKFRYSFGRQVNRTLVELRIPRVPSWVSGSLMKTVQRNLASDMRAVMSHASDEKRRPRGKSRPTRS